MRNTNQEPRDSHYVMELDARPSIRVANDSDLRSIVAHYGPSGGDSPWDPFADQDRIQRIPRQGLLVAETDGKYAGFIFWYEARKPWYAKDVDRYARISDLHIVPAFQGRGIGRALIRDALARIRAAGIETVFLETDEDNARARSLYESEGFVRVAPSVIRFRLG
jgi:[ribosomal protein S18]-alanine N-acetyltransferase